MTSRPSTAAPILAVLAVVFPIALYSLGYFWLGKRFELIGGAPEIYRTFETKLVVDCYGPMAWIEAKATGARVYLVWAYDPDPLYPKPFLPIYPERFFAVATP